MTTARDVEIIARAIYESEYDSGDYPWDKLSDGERLSYRANAKAVLAALLSAPLPIRLDLAKQLLPDDLFKDYAQFKAEARAKEQGK